MRSPRLSSTLLMRNVLAKVPHKEKGRFAAHLKQIWLEPDKKSARRVVGVFPSIESYVRLTICYLIEYAEDWSSERSYIREDKILGSLDKFYALTAQMAS